MTNEELIIAAYKRGFAWCVENGADHEYLGKAARDYADYTIHNQPSPVPPSPPRDEVVEALRELLHAVCGDTGFADAVRHESGKAYPWPALEIAEEKARRALSKLEPTNV